MWTLLTILPAVVGLTGFVVLAVIVAGLDFAITGSWGLS